VRGSRRPLLLAILVALVPAVAGAEMRLVPGFTAHVYVTGEGFDTTSRGVRGVPSASTLAFDRSGALYLARTGRRYIGGEADGLASIYRVPIGGGRVTPDSEAGFRYGPPLWNALVSPTPGGRDVLVTTFDRERRVGVVYRLVDGRAEFVLGGTPERGTPPVLVQPEGVAVDRAGNFFVADRDRGAIVRFDPAGRLVDPRWVTVMRPRALAMDDQDRLWIASDGTAEAPWQRGTGEIWRAERDGRTSRVLQGPMPAGIALSPGGNLLVADRHGARVFVVAPDGRTLDLATFTDGDAPRGLGVAPITPETQRAGIAGDLFLITISRGAWPANEVIRVTGPLDEFVARYLPPR
jgi:DNA-binding beta-propeller fold protein YncE